MSACRLLVHHLQDRCSTGQPRVVVWYKSGRRDQSYTRTCATTLTLRRSCRMYGNPFPDVIIYLLLLSLSPSGSPLSRATGDRTLLYTKEQQPNTPKLFKCQVRETLEWRSAGVCDLSFIQLLCTVFCVDICKMPGLRYWFQPSQKVPWRCA